MKIVDRKTFLSMPSETIFSKYHPCVFEELCIKGETWGYDFLVQTLADAIESSDSGEFVDVLDRSISTGESISMDFESQGRDGLFDDDQLFAVWERDDVRGLIARLDRCLPKDSDEQ